MQWKTTSNAKKSAKLPKWSLGGMDMGCRKGLPLI
jgi:hypothetical protein